MMLRPALAVVLVLRRRLDLAVALGMRPDLAMALILRPDLAVARALALVLRLGLAVLGFWLRAERRRAVILFVRSWLAEHVLQLGGMAIGL